MPADFSSAMQAAGNSVVETPNLPSRNDGNNLIDAKRNHARKADGEFNVAAQLVRSELKNVRAAIEEGR